MYSCVLPGKRGLYCLHLVPIISPDYLLFHCCPAPRDPLQELTSQEAQTQTADRPVAKEQVGVEAIWWPFLSVANRNRLSPFHGTVTAKLRAGTGSQDYGPARHRAADGAANRKPRPGKAIVTAIPTS